MDYLPWWAYAIALGTLLGLSAFFSIAETSMMALNRYRLAAKVKQGNRAAQVTQELLGKTDSLLGTILLGNNLVNAAVTALVTALATRLFGDSGLVLFIATTVVAFAIIVFCEITPKVIGANNPERIALPASYVLRFLMKFMKYAVGFVNLFVGWILKLLRIDPNKRKDARVTNEELRAMVLESGQFMPNKHRSMVINLFDLERITVDDVMTTRTKIEAIDITDPIDSILDQLVTCYHNKIPVYERDINRIIGILHLRKVLPLLRKEDFSTDELRELLTEPYFVPSETPVFTQLQYFQESKQRVGIVVDEYGEVQGLVTLEDIVEEVVGEFTTTAPGAARNFDDWDDADEVQVEGSSSLRELNRRLGTRFPIDGPKTLNGLVLEHLQELPEGPVSMRLHSVTIEILQIHDRSIRSLKLRRLKDRLEDQ